MLYRGNPPFCLAKGSFQKLSLPGVVGPSRSSTAEETADALRSIPMPIISPSATLATLTTGTTPHPNFFRTVPSDKVQIKVRHLVFNFHLAYFYP